MRNGINIESIQLVAAATFLAAHEAESLEQLDISRFAGAIGPINPDVLQAKAIGMHWIAVSFLITGEIGPAGDDVGCQLTACSDA